MRSLIGRHSTRKLLSVLSAAGIIVAGGSLRAATVTWDAGGASAGTPADGSGTWDNGTTPDWSNGATDSTWDNASSNTAAIGNGGTAGTISLSGSISVGGITFNPVTSGSYALTSGTLYFVGASPTVTMNANGVIGSVIAGTNALTMAGTGQLYLTGTNTYTGGTVINGGILNAAADSAMGSSSKGITINSGTLMYNGSAAASLGGGRLVTIGTSGATFAGFGGSTTALVTFGNGSLNMGTSGIGTRTITLVGSAVTGAAAGVSANSANTFDYGIVNDASNNATSVVISSGGWNLGKAGSTYTGSTTVSNGARLVIGSNCLSAATTLTISGSGVFVLSSAGTGVTQTISDLEGTSSTSVIAAVNASAASTLTIGTGNFAGNINSVNAERTLNLVVTGGTGGTIGNGTLTLSGLNTYTGNTIIEGGTLKVTSSNALGFGGKEGYASSGNQDAAVGVVTGSSGSTLDLNGNVTVDKPVTLSGASLINSNAGTTSKLDNGVAGITLTNPGTATSSASGTVTLTGGAANATATFNASATASQIYIQMSKPGSGFASTPSVTIPTTGGDSTATATAVLSSLTLNGTSNSIGGAGNLTIAAVIADGTSSGGFTKIGAGTVTLAGKNTYSGATAVNAGTLLVTGSISGTVSVGSSGVLAGNGGLGSSLNVTAGGEVAPSGASGSGIGTLTIASGSFTATSAFQLTLGTAAGTQAAAESGSTGLQLISLGSLAFPTAGTGAVTLNIVDNANAGGNGSLGAGWYEFASSTALTSDATSFSIGNAPAGFTYNVVPDGQVLDLDVLVSVPEPQTWAMFLGSIGILVVWQRSRKRHA